MTRTPWVRLILVATGLLAVVPIKCNSILEKPTPVAADDGYEYVQKSGSLIQERVKKGSGPTTGSANDLGSEAARQMLQRAQSMDGRGK